MSLLKCLTPNYLLARDTEILGRCNGNSLSIEANNNNFVESSDGEDDGQARFIKVCIHSIVLAIQITHWPMEEALNLNILSHAISGN